jgi:hypothetical protein
VAGRVGHIKVESIARVVLACWRQITGGSRNLAQPPKMESRGILYLPYCTCHYIHIMSAQETSEKGLSGAGKLPGCGLPAGGRKRPPGPTPEWLGSCRPIKKAVTLRLDADVLGLVQTAGMRLADEN